MMMCGCILIICSRLVRDAIDAAMLQLENYRTCPASFFLDEHMNRRHTYFRSPV